MSDQERSERIGNVIACVVIAAIVLFLIFVCGEDPTIR